MVDWPFHLVCVVINIYQLVVPQLANHHWKLIGCSKCRYKCRCTAAMTFGHGKGSRSLHHENTIFIRSVMNFSVSFLLLFLCEIFGKFPLRVHKHNQRYTDSEWGAKGSLQSSPFILTPTHYSYFTI